MEDLINLVAKVMCVENGMNVIRMEYANHAARLLLARRTDVKRTTTMTTLTKDATAMVM